MDIDTLNTWLEKQAQDWEREISTDPSLFGSTLPDYFRSLKDLDQKDSFTVSSFCLLNKKHTPLQLWITENQGDYDCIGFTGYANFIKK